MPLSGRSILNQQRGLHFMVRPALLIKPHQKPINTNIKTYIFL